MIENTRALRVPSMNCHTALHGSGALEVNRPGQGDKKGFQKTFRAGSAGSEFVG